MTYIVSSGALNSTHSLDVGLEVYAVYSVAAVVLKQDNSPTANLKKKNHGITILYLYIKPNHNPNFNPIEYWQRINSVICLK